MSNPIDRLQTDHANFAQLLAILEQELARIEALEPENAEVMRDVMTYISRYSDRIHHPTEDLIYARLADKSPSARARLADVPRDHTALAEESQSLAQMLAGLIDGEMIERDRVVERGRHFIGHLREHMALEERHLFPAAREVLDHDDLNEVERILDDTRDPIFGPVVDDDFRDLFSHIERQVA